MADDSHPLQDLAEGNGFDPDGLRVLLAVIHGHSMRRSLSGDGPHLGAEQVVSGLWNTVLERFGILARDVLVHWGFGDPEQIGQAVEILIDAGFLQRSSDELDDYGTACANLVWPEPPPPPPMREIVGWGGF